MNVQKVLLCSFQCEPRPSGVTLESAGLKNIPQVPGNRAEVGQNRDAGKAHREIDQVQLDFTQLLGYFPERGTLN